MIAASVGMALALLALLATVGFAYWRATQLQKRIRELKTANISILKQAVELGNDVSSLRAKLRAILDERRSSPSQFHSSS